MSFFNLEQHWANLSPGLRYRRQGLTTSRCMDVIQRCEAAQNTGEVFNCLMAVPDKRAANNLLKSLAYRLERYAPEHPKLSPSSKCLKVTVFGCDVDITIAGDKIRGMRAEFIVMDDAPKP